MFLMLLITNLSLWNSIVVELEKSLRLLFWQILSLRSILPIRYIVTFQDLLLFFCWVKKLPAANWKYIGDNSNYVWDNLKYLRHIFCYIYTCWFSSAWPLTVFVCLGRIWCMYLFRCRDFLLLLFSKIVSEDITEPCLLRCVS